MQERIPLGVAWTLAAWIGLAWATPPARGDYTSTAAGSLGGPLTVGYALNDEGAIAGQSTTAQGGPAEPFLVEGSSTSSPDSGYDRGGTLTAISDSGHVAGFVVGDLHGTPFATLDGSGIPGTGLTSQAAGVNDAGLVVGPMTNPTLGPGSFVAQPLTLPGGMTVLQSAALQDLTTGDLVRGSATGVNDAGQVVGNLFEGHAFLFNPGAGPFGSGTVLDLGALPGLSGGTSQALAINASGQVIGTATSGAMTQGFFYSSGAVTPLSFTPEGINALGQVIGTTTDPATSAVRLLLFDPRTGATTDLSDVTLGGGYQLLDAAGINASGQILVNGIRPDSGSPLGYDEEAFLLSPGLPSGPPVTPSAVPEPAGATLIVVGGLGLLAARVVGRRRARRP